MVKIDVLVNILTIDVTSMSNGNQILYSQILYLNSGTFAMTSIWVVYNRMVFTFIAPSWSLSDSSCRCWFFIYDGGNISLRGISI